MKIKFFAVTAAAVLVSSFMFACSSSSSSGGGFSCPAVGSKTCSNDQAVTQDQVDACNKCLSQYQAFASCASAQGEATTAACDSSGNDVAPSQDVQTKVSQNCGSQESALVSCILPASGDAG
jgi:hypothetical protein